MNSLNRTLGRYASFGPLIVRVVLGGLFVLHGIDKFRGGLAGVEEMFSSNGVPAAALSAPLSAVLEVTIGAALIAGLYTRVAAAVLALFLAGAIFWIKADGGIIGSAETDLAYMSGLAALVLLGPGRFSADQALLGDDHVIDLRTSARDHQDTRLSVGS